MEQSGHILSGQDIVAAERTIGFALDNAELLGRCNRIVIPSAFFYITEFASSGRIGSVKKFHQHLHEFRSRQFALRVELPRFFSNNDASGCDRPNGIAC
ncbi:hypothetical protein D3C76_1404040 [compost metagenome]